MRMLLLILLFQIALVHTSIAQVKVIDTDQLIPVKINNIFFTMLYTIVPTKKERIADQGLADGQIFTYKGDAKNKEDLQSLALIKRYIYDDQTQSFIECTEDEIIMPNRKYSFKLILACMSRAAGAPRRSLNADNIEPSMFKILGNQYRQFLEGHKTELEFYENSKPKGLIVPENTVKSRREATPVRKAKGEIR